MRSYRRQRGYLLITVVVALFLLATVAMLLTHDSAISANTASSELESARAEYIAEAGMQHALWRTQNNACMGDVTIPDTALGAGSYNATITGAAAGTLVTVSADQDAWIRSDDVTRNNGTTAWNHVRNEVAGTEQVLTRFDVSPIAAGAQISSAVAWFHLKAGKTHPSGPITLHEITADWTETAVTWESFSGAYGSSVIGTIPAQDTGDVWVGVNLSAQVQAWVNGQPNYGVLMSPRADGTHAEYTAREDGGNAPRLEVVVGSGQASPVTVKATGTLADGNTRTLTRPVSPALQPSGTYTFRPDATEGIDAYIWEAQKTTNKGTDDETWVSRTSNNASLSLLKFNMGAIPAHARILTATLSLHNRSGNNSNVPVTAHRITNPWDEDFVTWNNRESGTPWDTAGGDVDTTAIAMTKVGPTRYIRYEWDITSLVQGWTDGAYANYGVALATAMASSVGERFDTSDHADPLRRPSLTVTYGCECGSACMAPQGAGNILMVVDEKASLKPGDQITKSILESWGYAVNLISDNVNQNSFNAEFANNDVVYVSESIDAVALSSKLDAAPIGVVSADADLNDRLGMSTTKGTPVGHALDVVDTSHYITRIFAAGTLEFKTVATELAATSGSKSPDAQVLATAKGLDALVALESGGISTKGGTVSSRRVLLPVGDSDVSWGYLTNSGQLMVQRSLGWAMNAAGGSIGNLLLVVGNATTLADKDADRKTLIESWGYTVTLIDDGADQAEFDTEADASDVIYVTASIGGGTLADKLTDSTAPIVNEFSGKLDNFGFGSQVPPNTVSIDYFTATDAAHYITQPFGGSGITYFTTGLTMPVASGTLAPDLGEVASVGTLTWLVPVLDAGAERWDGNPSPGRRVHLPFGEANISQLTPDGETLMKRAIEWAAALVSLGPIAHWKLDDGTGTTAVDSEGGHNGMLTNGPVWVTGHLGDALEFDGSDDYVDLTSDAELDDVFDGGATVMAWIRPFNWGENGYGRVFDKSSSASATGDGWVVRLNKDNDGINFGQGFSGGRGWWRIPSGSISLDAWQHVAIGYDARSTSNDPVIYLDGNTLDVTRVDTPSGSIRTDAAINLRLGNHAGGTAHTFAGIIDDARIYDRVLTAAEIAEIASGVGSVGTYLDEFNAIAYNGNDGSLDWSNDWQETGEGDGPGSGDFRVINSSWCATGNCLQIREDQTSTRRLSREADLTGAVAATLSLNYRRRHVSSPIGGTITLEISDDSGMSFTPLKAYAMGTQDSSQQSDSFDISPYIASNTQIRFSTSDVLYETALYVDNVLIDTTDGGGGGGGGGGSCDGTFRDEFSATSFANNDGTLTWDGDWLEVGESDGPSSGDVRVRDDNGPYQLWIRDNNNGGEGVERQADLSGASSATLSFIYRRSLLDNENDYVKLEISSNGAAGPWTELARIEGPGTDSAYLSFSQSIDDYVSPNTRIRLISSPTMGNTDLVIFDDIEISCSP